MYFISEQIESKNNAVFYGVVVILLIIYENNCSDFLFAQKQMCLSILFLMLLFLVWLL